MGEGKINLVLTVGNSMMGDDGAGPLLAKLMEEHPVADWQVLDGGSMPEDTLYIIRKMRPTKILIVDAADIGISAGELRFVEKKQIADLFIMSTHAMPLSFLMDSLEEITEHVVFLGIQPDVVAFYHPMTKAVEDAVYRIHRELATGLATVAWLN